MEENDDTTAVIEKVCIERVGRLKSEIESGLSTVVAKVEGVDNKIDLLIENCIIILNKHEEKIETMNGKIGGISTQVTELVQWKVNGERGQDVWYKRQAFVTGVAVLLVGILSNISKITVVLKEALVLFSGGK